MKILVSFFLIFFLKGAFAEEKDIFIYSINDLIGLQVTFTYEDGNQCTYQFFEDKKMLSDCYDLPLEYTIYQKGEFFEKGGLIKWNVQGESRRHDYLFEGIVYWDEDKTINTLVSYNGTDFVYDSLSGDMFFTSVFDDIYIKKESSNDLTATKLIEVAGCFTFYSLVENPNQEYLQIYFDTHQEFIQPTQDWMAECISLKEDFNYCYNKLEPLQKEIVDEQIYASTVAKQSYEAEMIWWRASCLPLK